MTAGVAGAVGLGVAVPIGLMVTVLTLGAGRSLRQLRGVDRLDGVGSLGGVGSRASGGACGQPRALLGALLPGRGGHAVTADLGLVCAGVAARVRSGQEPAQAWASELGAAGHRGPRARGGLRGDARGAGATRSEAGLPRELTALLGTSPGADAAYVATRVALHSGAPLADVLDSVAVAVAEAEAAEADRRRARTGPATTARLLGWLPLGALVLGMGLGADPVRIASEGGLGFASMLAGAGLMVAGRWWVRALVRAAESDGGVDAL